MSRQKIAKHLRSVSAGISLEPAITKKAKALAKAKGHSSLSGYVRVILTEAINSAAEKAEKLGQQQTASAKQKLRQSAR